MSKAKAKGTRYETNVKNVINDWSGDPKTCERIALHGNKDHGDLRIIVDDLVLTGECKDYKKMLSEGMLAKFKEQAVEENANAGQDGALLIVNFPNRAIDRSQVHMLKSTLARLNGIERLITDERIPEDLRQQLWQAVMVDGEYDWVCITLFQFLNIAYGHPAWGR